MSMQVTFYGVRGSLPVSGPGRMAHGCNTSCVHVRVDPSTHLIFDGGTGIQRLNKVVARGDRVIVLLSHFHWDHIQGLPFFQPLFNGHNHVTLASASPECAEDSMRRLMDGTRFPVRFDQRKLTGHVSFVHVDELDALVGRHDLRVRMIAQNHPGGSSGFRLSWQGKSIVYATDHELRCPEKLLKTDFEKFVRFCKGADCLIHDAQFVEAERQRVFGWGHSVVSDVLELAARAKVGSLYLFHHDVDRTDRMLDTIVADAGKVLRELGSHAQIFAARERVKVEV